MASAFATVKLRIACKSNWSDDTTMKQIVDQAKTDAMHQLADAINSRRDMDLIGNVEITAVHIAEKNTDG